MSYQNGNAVSLAPPRQKIPLRKGFLLKFPGKGAYLSTNKEFVLDYYSGGTDAQEVVLSLEFDDADIVSGKEHLQDREPVVTVSKAKVVDWELLTLEASARKTASKIEQSQIWTRFPHFDDSDRKVIIDKLLEWVGSEEEAYDNLVYFAKGAYAWVYWLKHNRKQILKITSDESDAKASMILKNKPDKNLLKVYDVIKIGNIDLWAILVEKLNPLSSSQTKMWEDAQGALDSMGVTFRYEGLTKDKLEEAQDAAEDASSGGYQDWSSAIHRVLPTLEKWEKALAARGILWKDFHPGNVLMRGRVPIIADLGKTDIHGSPNIPKLGFVHANHATEITARKVQPISGEIITDKIKAYAKDFLLTEKRYDSLDPEVKQMFNYSYWAKTVKEGLKYGISFSDRDPPLIKIYLGTYQLDWRIFHTFQKNIERHLRGWGWYVLRSKLPKLDGDTYSVDLAPNYGKPLQDVPSTIYHLALKKNIPSIRRKGLIPMKGRQHGVSLRGYPDRIYFATSLSMIQDLYEGFVSRQPDEEGEYGVISVDTHKLRKGTKFYEDPELPYRSGLWTYTHIPANAIVEMDSNTLEASVKQATTELVARKVKPLPGTLVENKIRALLESYFLTEKMYATLPEEEKVPFFTEYKDWLKEYKYTLKQAVSYSKENNLITINTVPFRLEDALFPKFHQQFIKHLKGWGWYTLTSRMPKSQDGLTYRVDVAPNYGDIIQDVPKTLYHIALKENLPSIQRKGLIPRKGRAHGGALREYPDRIYFARSMNIIYDLYDAFIGRNYEEEGQYAVVTIDTSRLRHTTFYNDPELPKGHSMWTYTHVPASAIVNVESEPLEASIKQARSTTTVYHGTTTRHLSQIKRQGLIAKKGYDSPKWYMVSEDFESASHHAKGYQGDPVVIAFDVPTEDQEMPNGRVRKKWEGFPYLWKPTTTEWDGNTTRWWALRQPLPAEFIAKIMKVGD